LFLLLSFLKDKKTFSSSSFKHQQNTNGIPSAYFKLQHVSVDVRPRDQMSTEGELVLQHGD